MSGHAVVLAGGKGADTAPAAWYDAASPKEQADTMTPLLTALLLGPVPAAPLPAASLPRTPPELAAASLVWARFGAGDAEATAICLRLADEAALPADLRATALFHLAQRLKRGGWLPQAADAYLRLLNDFPRSPHRAEAFGAIFTIARLWLADARQDMTFAVPGRWYLRPLCDQMIGNPIRRAREALVGKGCPEAEVGWRLACGCPGPLRSLRRVVGLLDLPQPAAILERLFNGAPGQPAPLLHFSREWPVCGAERRAKELLTVIARDSRDPGLACSALYALAELALLRDDFASAARHLTDLTRFHGDFGQPQVLREALYCYSFLLDGPDARAHLGEVEWLLRLASARYPHLAVAGETGLVASLYVRVAQVRKGMQSD
jgi:hypothetical protein